MFCHHEFNGCRDEFSWLLPRVRGRGWISTIRLLTRYTLLFQFTDKLRFFQCLNVQVGFLYVLSIEYFPQLSSIFYCSLLVLSMNCSDKSEVKSPQRTQQYLKQQNLFVNLSFSVLHKVDNSGIFVFFSALKIK